MRTVTSIKPSKTGRKLRVELSDGGYFYADADGEAAKLLAEGDEIDDETLVRWRAHGGLTAEEAAALALGRRARSEKELRGKLADKGFTPDEADRALDRMRELGFLDDRALAEEIVAACAAENRSRRAALEALRRRGIEG
ncbi:MAG: RecX family transcriptional regulator, partial [Oscillospiraceae bacterium]|nr:RecX family transcriptional regulator [Oscillospiraceae bacterium]